LRYFYISDNIVVFKTVYPSTIAYLWLANTKRMTHLEGGRSLACVLSRMWKVVYVTTKTA